MIKSDSILLVFTIENLENNQRFKKSLYLSNIVENSNKIILNYIIINKKLLLFIILFIDLELKYRVNELNFKIESN